jgi:hypothetical protein
MQPTAIASSVAPVVIAPAIATGSSDLPMLRLPAGKRRDSMH